MKKLFTFVVLAVMSIVTVFAVNSGAAEETEPTATLNVSVTDEQGNPVEGAYVFFNGLEDVTTDAAGKSTITVPAADVTGKMVAVEVYKDGYVPFTAQADFTNGLTASVNATLKAATASLTVIVSSGDDLIANAQVSFMGNEYQTGENGQVVISGINFLDVFGKTVPFTVYKDGYEFYEGEADFTENMDASALVELTASEATLTIKVVTGEENEQEPIEGAMVSFNGEDYTTPENGEIKITGIKAPEVIGKEVPYTVYKDGYDFFEGTADFTETSDAFAIATLKVAMASLTFNVVSEDWEPISGANITFEGKNYTTDENGRCTISNLPATDYVTKTFPVTIYKDGYVEYQKEFEFDMLECDVVAQLEAEKASLTFNVVSGDYEPIEGATITFDGKDYTTDENGRYTITDLSAPNYITKTFPVTIYKDGYVMYENEFEFDSFECSVVATLTPEKASVTFNVVTEDYEPIDGAYVTFNGEGYTTDENGKFVIEDLNAPDYIFKTFSVTAYKDGYEPWEDKEWVFEGLEAYVTATLEPAEATLNVQVFLNDEPVEGASVSALQIEALTDADGKATLTLNGPDVIHKEIPVTIYKDGYEVLEQTADFSDGLSAYVIVEELKPEKASVTFNVVTEDYEPIDGAYVTFDGKEYTTDENGKLVIEDLNAPDYINKTFTVTAYKDGYEPWEDKEWVFEGLEAFVTATLEPSEATFSIQVLANEVPVVGAYVSALGSEAYTDEYGRAVLKLNGPDVIGKEIPVSIYKDGYESAEVIADFTDNQLNVIYYKDESGAIELKAEKASVTFNVRTEDMEPVAGVTVTFDGKEGVTDENGKFVFEDLNAPDYIAKTFTVTAYKDRYEDWVDQEWLFDVLEANVTVVLEPAKATLTVKVTTDNEEDPLPLAGARVILDGQMDQPYFTNDNGEAVIKDLNGFELLGTTLPVMVLKDGYDPFEGEADFTQNLDAWLVAPLKASEASLTVKAMFGEDPVKDATVTFQGQEYTTDENGEAKIEGIDGPSVIGKTIPYYVSKDGYDTFEGEATFEVLELQVVATLVEAQATFTVKVMGGEEPIEGALVTFGETEMTTPENGEVKFTGIPALEVMGKKVPYSVLKDGYEVFEGEADFTETQDAYEIAALTPFEATLTVKVMAGEDPVEEAMVTFQDQEYFTDVNGEVKIEGINGPSVMGQKVPYTVYKDGYEYFEGEADFTEILETYAVATLVEAQATFTVKVMSGEEPVEGALVTFGETEMTTPENGEVKFTGIPALEVMGKKVSYSVLKDGYEYFEGEADFTETQDAYEVAELTAAEATLTVKALYGEGVVADAIVIFNNQEYTTDENGAVKITGLYGPDFIGQKFPVSVYKDGFTPFEGEADFSETQDAWVIAELEAEIATLKIKVMDGEEPVADAVVTFMGEEYTTDQNGEISINNLAAPDVMGQKIDFTVAKPGYITYTGKADFTETQDAFEVVEFQKDDSAIESILINGVDGDTKVYDLQGRRVLHPRKGQIYIVNGRKVLFK